jgi:hypothetical protein
MGKQALHKVKLRRFQALELRCFDAVEVAFVNSDSVKTIKLIKHKKSEFR